MANEGASSVLIRRCSRSKLCGSCWIVRTLFDTVIEIAPPSCSHELHEPLEEPMHRQKTLPRQARRSRSVATASASFVGDEGKLETGSARPVWRLYHLDCRNLEFGGIHLTGPAAAVGAHEPPIAQPPAPGVARSRAGEAVGPSQPLQVVQAVRVAPEPGLELAHGPRVVHASTRSVHPLSLVRLNGYPRLELSYVGGNAPLLSGIEAG